MPELPEIEIVKRSLFKMINKAKIIDIKVNNKNLRYKIPNSFSKHLIDEKILKISRRSKYIIFHFERKLLLAHMGMSGKLLLMRSCDNTIFKTSFYYDSNILQNHNHIYFVLNNGLVLVYNDVRRFGFFKLYNTTHLNKITFLKKLGLEPFNKTFNIKYFEKFVQNKKKIEKNANVNWFCNSAEKLPFKNNYFDYYTISFGIRNVSNINNVLKEAHRVLKPGGRFLCLEFSKVKNEILNRFYKIYSKSIPQIG